MTPKELKAKLEHLKEQHIWAVEYAARLEAEIQKLEEADKP